MATSFSAVKGRIVCESSVRSTTLRIVAGREPDRSVATRERSSNRADQLSRHFECSVNPKVSFCWAIADTRHYHSLTPAGQARSSMSDMEICQQQSRMFCEAISEKMRKCFVQVMHEHPVLMHNARTDDPAFEKT